MKDQPISHEELVAYASGELRDAEAARVEAYLALAPDTASEVAALRHVLETLRADDSEAPAAELVARVVAARSDKPRATMPDWLVHARRIVAELIFDSRAQLALDGYRGAGSSCQLAYETQCGRVDLRVSENAAGPKPWRIRGQVVLGEDAQVGPVALVAAGTTAPVATVSADQFGRFRIDAAPGRYDLLVSLDQGQRVIVHPALEVGDSV